MLIEYGNECMHFGCFFGFLGFLGPCSNEKNSEPNRLCTVFGDFIGIVLFITSWKQDRGYLRGGEF